MKSIVLIIGIPLISGLLLVFIYLISKHYQKKRITLALENLTTIVEKNKLKAIQLIVDRLIINEKARQAIEHFQKLTNQLFREADQIKAVEANFKTQIRQLISAHQQFKYKTIKMQLRQLLTFEKTLDVRIKKFKSKAKALTQQEDFLRNEFSFYRQNLHEISNVYNQKKILFQKAAAGINEIYRQISVLNDDFDLCIAKGENEKSSVIITNFKRVILQLAVIVDKFPKISFFLEQEVPQQLQHLLEQDQNIAQNMHFNLLHLAFQERFKALKQKFSAAKTALKQLKILEAAQLVVAILQAITTLQEFMKTEMRAWELFTHIYTPALNAAEQLVNKYRNSEPKLAEISLVNHSLNAKFKNKRRIISAEISETKVIINDFKTLANQTQITYAAKVLRAKMLLNHLLKITTMINEMVHLVALEKIQKQQIRNKYLQLTNVLEQLQRAISVSDLNLTNEETQKIVFFQKELNRILKILWNSKTNAQHELIKIADTVRDMASFYQLIAGKVKFMELVRTIIQSLAPQRAINVPLNYALLAAERKYMEGEYALALQLIVEEFEQIKKRRKYAT